MTEDIKNQQAQDYDASQIQVLEGLEAVRMRPDLPKLEFDWHHNLVPVGL